MTIRARCVLDIKNTLGESIVWCDRQEALYWTDIQAATLYRYRPFPRALRSWPMPERLCCIGLCEADGWLLLGLESKLAFFHIESERLLPLTDIEPDLPTRLNDGVCDRQGRFVFGTLHEPQDGGPKRAVGGFYRLNLDLSVERLPLAGVAISNSLAFSEDGGTMYHCDSTSGRIEQSRYGSDGHVSGTRTFVDRGATPGTPDGATVDAEDGLWNARWGAGRVIRYDADGCEDFAVEVPASQPTRATFGGKDLTTLYIISARDGLTAAALGKDAFAGGLFAAPNLGPGLREPRFAAPEGLILG